MMETKQVKIGSREFTVDARTEYKGQKIRLATDQLFMLGKLVGLYAEGKTGSKTPNKKLVALKLNRHQCNQICKVLLSEQKAKVMSNRIAKAKSFLASQGITAW